MSKQKTCFHQERSSTIANGENKRKIAYGRVGRVHELSGQRAIIGQIYKFATYGIANDNIFFDFGSANANNRPAFDAVLEKIKEGGVDSLVVTCLDRISRNLLKFQSFMELLKEFQVELVVLDQPESKGNGLKKISGLWPSIK
jgi:DNA invertase Pin-like site-specific DNA recombinase